MNEYPFNDEQKIKAFDILMKSYYQKNFGQLAKADIDLLMFHFYMDAIINNDCQSESNRCSDYNISKDLGITQQRVRNLKIKEQLRFPRKINIKDDFLSLIKQARYDKNTKKISLCIRDPNLFIEIQNLIEEQGGFIDLQLNSKVLSLREEYFVDLLLMLEPDDSKEKIIEILKDEFNNYDIELIEGKSIGKRMIEKGLAASTLFGNLVNTYECTSKIITLVAQLLQVNNHTL